MTKQCNCYACGSIATSSIDHENDRVFYECPICGRFQIGLFDGISNINENHLASYLLYHRFPYENVIEYRYHTTLDKESCDKYNQDFKEGNNTHGRPVHMDAEMIENWYPKTFAERVDYILLYINSRTPHIGQPITLSFKELLGMLFIDREEINPEYSSTGYGKWIERKEEDCEIEIKYFLDYLSNNEYIRYNDGPSEEEWVDLSLMPAGYARIDELQKNSTNSRNVLVAMKFGDDTKTLREAIREGVKKAEYSPIFIDEVQHNDLITPELLKQIKDSKFVVVDLTHQNNGAYFEEGYAMGLGKPVIQLCKKGTVLHFDIAQKNTIMWDAEEDIIDYLYNRIKATID